VLGNEVISLVFWFSVPPWRLALKPANLLSVRQYSNMAAPKLTEWAERGHIN
jgi:hypothetical protein